MAVRGRRGPGSPWRRCASWSQRAWPGLAAACGAGTGAGTGAAAEARPNPINAAALSASGVTITETGSTLLYPLARAWAAAYHQQNPGVTVTTAGTGSGAASRTRPTARRTIGASDAYLSSGDLVPTPRLLNIPLAVSAQTVIYNLPGLPPGSHLQLNGTVLAEIYSGRSPGGTTRRSRR